jgi:hypothetical protein
MIYDREWLNVRRVPYAVPLDEYDHFVTCPVCWMTIDCRRQSDVFLYEERCSGIGKDNEQ